MTSTPASDYIDKVAKIKRESVVYEHSGEVPDVDPPDPSATVEQASTRLVDRVVDAEQHREKFLQFLEAGHRGFLAHDGDELVARGWIYTPESTSVPYNLPDWVSDMDVYWLFYARTMEGHRQEGWHKYLLTRRLKWIYDRDPDATVYTDASPENVSRYTFDSTGFEPKGTMTTYRIGHPSFTVVQLGTWDVDDDHPPMPEGR